MANWDVFRDLDDLRREIDAAFRGFGSVRALPAAFLAGPATRRFPQVNLSEDGTNVYLQALIPGVDPNDLEMTVLGNSVTISGERKPPLTGGKPHVWHRNERGYGRFRRTIELSTDVDADAVTAECRDGILQVVLMKREAAKPKKIAVSVG